MFNWLRKYFADNVTEMENVSINGDFVGGDMVSQISIGGVNSKQIIGKGINSQSSGSSKISNKDGHYTIVGKVKSLTVNGRKIDIEKEGFKKEPED